MSPAPHRILLARMENALRETSRHLTLIERQIEARAERMTVTSRTKRRRSGRGTSTWTRADERAFRDTMAALTLARRSEIGPQDHAARERHRSSPTTTWDRTRGHARDRVELLPAAALRLISAGALVSQSYSGMTPAIRSRMPAVQA
jgi:hypothetical protein